MKKKRMLVLLLQFILMIASVGGIIFYMNSQTDTTEVFVYTKTFVEANQVVTESDVRVTTIPTIAVTEHFAKTKEDIVGKFLQSPVTAGQYIYTTQLVDTEEQDVFETMDLSQYRKISLPIDMIEGLSGNIKRGDYIDLVYTGVAQKAADEMYSSSDFTYSNAFLQKVLVFSVNTAEGYRFDGYSDIPQGGVVNEEGETVERSGLGIITLAVTLPQAEEIYARRQIGKISFVGRFNKSSDIDTNGFAVGDYGPVFAGEAPIEIHNIDEFRGNAPSETAGMPIIGTTEEGNEQ